MPTAAAQAIQLNSTAAIPELESPCKNDSGPVANRRQEEYCSPRHVVRLCSWQDQGLYQQREWSDFIVIIDAIAGLNAAFSISVVLIDEPLFIGLL